MPKLVVQVLIIGFFLLPIFLLSRCANRMAPTGGPRDSLAPFVINSIPIDQSTNYNGEIVIVEFNEWIREKQLRQQLLITPPTKKYTSRVIRTRVEVRFEDPLEENTTYSLNFRNGIEDITEGNTAVLDTITNKPLKIAFSTGDMIDSMSVSGTIYNRLNDEKVEEVIIALYNPEDTLEFDKHPPYYFTVSDEEGNFAIDNVKAGTYRIYAIKDENQDLIYQEPEAIGFFTEPIVLGDTSVNLENQDLKIAVEDHTPPEVIRNRPEGLYHDITFSEPITNIKAATIPSDTLAYTDTLTYQIQKDPKTIRFFNLQAVYDSIPIRIEATDTISNVAIDTLMIVFKAPEEKERSRRNERAQNQKAPFDMQIISNEVTDKELNIAFQFSKPVSYVDFDKISYLPDQDSTRLGPLLVDSLTTYRWNFYRTELYVQRITDFQDIAQIIADSLAFISIEQDTLSQVSNQFSIKDPAQFGSIYGRVSTEEPHYILQLLDAQDKKVAESIDEVRFEFSFLPAGNYRLRIVLDSNQNGKWDTSDVANNIPAEEVLFRVLPNEGRLREKWDIEAVVVF